MMDATHSAAMAKKRSYATAYDRFSTWDKPNKIRYRHSQYARCEFQSLVGVDDWKRRHVLL
jgi:hypothetical protein